MFGPVTGCLTLIVLQTSCDCRCSVAFFTVPWAGLQCVIVIFCDHTQILFLSVLHSVAIILLRKRGLVYLH